MSLITSRRGRLIGLAATGLLFLVACGGAASPGSGGSPAPVPTSEPGPTIGRPQAAAVNVPRDFQWQAYSGEAALGAKELKFSQVFAKGQPVVLNFFAGLCPPCRAEMPDLQSLSVQFEDRVLLLGVDIGPFVGLGSRDSGRALVKELGVTYPTGTTTDGRVAQAYRVLGMPTTVFLTPEGKVFKTWSGLLTKSKMVELTEGLVRASGK